MLVRFIRHGEASHNVDYFKHGEVAFDFEENAFSPLTALGRFQSRNLGEKYDFEKEEILITSSQPRTLETTSLILESNTNSNLKVYVADLVRECNFSHLCNKRRLKSEITREFPTFDASMVHNEEDLDFNTSDNEILRFESLDSLLTFFRDIGTKKITIVSHGTFINEYMVYKGCPSKYLKNCGIVEYNH